jgi:hypothetical protein
MVTGIAERTIRKTAFVTVRDALVCQTNLKNRGIFPKADTLVFSDSSAMDDFDIRKERKSRHDID